MSSQSTQQQRLLKITRILDAVAAEGWSVNNFLTAFYASSDPTVAQKAHSNLAYTEGHLYGPEKVLDLWLEHVPAGKSKQFLRSTLTRKVAGIVITESTAALHKKELHMTSTTVTVSDLSTDFALPAIAKLYREILPCLWLFLSMLITAPNDYERWNNVSKQDKDQNASRIIVVIISMLLYGRNRATNAFQLVMGIFLSSAGASRRVIDVCNHMGISVSYVSVQRCLVQLTVSAKKAAINFVHHSGRLFGLVYDNINFTLRKFSQRLDSLTEQLNATTSAVFSLPSKFTCSTYCKFLSNTYRTVGRREDMKFRDLMPTEAQQVHITAAFKHQIRTILLEHAPSIQKDVKLRKRLRKKAKPLKPKIRTLGHEKTAFFPLPALDQEEASVGGTIKVVTKLFKSVLQMAVDTIPAVLRLMVSDWLTIRNLRLMKDERADEFSSFERMDWVQEVSMPFHFQLNAMYMLCRTHIGYAGDNNPSSLEHHRSLLRRYKLDPTKPEYNKARELVWHSLIARILDCVRVLLKKARYNDLNSWKPTWQEFEDIVSSVVERFASTDAGHKALNLGDEVLAHSIFFTRDSLFFMEFSEGIKDADVGRMWAVYDFWVFMMRGAGCHNYGNEILEMKAQFKYEFSPELQEIIENTWLVNQWGLRGHSIPTDLYLEHNNGFTKNMFAAMGSNASMEYVQNKSSACVEVLRTLSHEVTGFFGLADFHRRHQEVDAESDIQALCLDMEIQKVHTLTSNRRVLPPKARKTAKRTKAPRTTGVRDVLLEGLEGLTEKNLFKHWKQRTAKEGVDAGGNGDDDEHDDLVTGTVFDNPNGVLEVEVELDREFAGDCATMDPDVSGQTNDDEY